MKLFLFPFEALSNCVQETSLSVVPVPQNIRPELAKVQTPNQTHYALANYFDKTLIVHSWGASDRFIDYYVALKTARSQTLNSAYRKGSLHKKFADSAETALFNLRQRVLTSTIKLPAAEEGLLELANFSVTLDSERQLKLDQQWDFYKTPYLTALLVILSGLCSYRAWAMSVAYHGY